MVTKLRVVCRDEPRDENFLFFFFSHNLFGGVCGGAITELVAPITWIAKTKF